MDCYLKLSRVREFAFPSFLNVKLLRAIFCKSNPTCDSKVFRISSCFNQLKKTVIIEYGRSFKKHFVDFFFLGGGGGGWGSRNNITFSRTAISAHELYFEGPLSLLELLFRLSFQSSSYFYMNLVRNWTQSWKFDKLAHCIWNFKGVYVIGADVQIHDHRIFSFSNVYL